MTIQERFDKIKEIGEEIITEEDLKALLDKKEHPVAYDGFEPSGNLHIAQGIVRAININKLTSSGVKFKMLVADWHGWANNKMGGDLEKIQNVGKYQIEVWRACGMDLDNVEFIWVSDYVSNPEYWKIVMRVSREMTLKRALRCCQIMGRKEDEALHASQILYASMQAADIFFLNADICQLGMDQRKVNMLAREVGPKIGFYKPVAIHHHMLMGLSEPPKSDLSSVDKKIEMKMSKSKPDTAIFMTDSEEEILRKIKKAYCPQGQIEENPILEYCRYIIFERFDTLLIERPEKFGGNLEFNSYSELEESFRSGQLHALDLKNSVAGYINKLIQPVREHFEKDPKAKELLEKIKSYEITR